MFKTLTAATLLLATSGTVLAGDYSPAIDARQSIQTARILQGASSGALTPFETGRLLRQQANVRAMERRFEADGHLGPVERERLNHRLNHSSGNIFLKKHNRRGR